AARGEVRTERIEYRHGDVQLKGYLAYDDSFTGRRSGVLLVHEWWGLNRPSSGTIVPWPGRGRWPVWRC
ncbi:MAG TPA: hypothetical protein VF799_10910, partial [Geobacteraceae bacterium]